MTSTQTPPDYPWIVPVHGYGYCCTGCFTSVLLDTQDTAAWRAARHAEGWRRYRGSLGDGAHCPACSAQDGG